MFVFADRCADWKSATFMLMKIVDQKLLVGPEKESSFAAHGGPDSCLYWSGLLFMVIFIPIV